ncbi:MAG: FtsX-like permease family protein [Saprospiraceae bacterium]|nr:FtsX-like permease family protein [Saprospiraceae bacterium]MBP7699122.1 FtsX-like permease family protein [Saprospiraceae bacterium]
MNNITLSWKNIWNKPLSSMLCILLLALGIGLSSFLLLLNQQLEDKFGKNVSGVNLVIGAKGSPLQLILCSMFHIDAPTGNIKITESKAFLNPQHPFIQAAAPLSLGDNYKGYRIVGTTYSFLPFYNAKIGSGKLFANTMDITAGSDVAQKLNLNIGDEFDSSHGLIEDDYLVHEHAHKFKVVGILQTTGTVIDQLLLTPVNSIWEVHEHGDADHHEHEAIVQNSQLKDYDGHEITSMLLKFKGRNIQTLNLQRTINENTNLQAATPALEINRLYSMMGVGTNTLQLLAFIILIVSAISVFVSLYNSLKERKYELALLRTLGGSRVKLLILILTESLLLCLLGFILGMIISHTAMELLAGYLQQTYRYSFTGRIFLAEEWGLLAITVIIGVLAALLPAVQAYKSDISKILSK